MSLLSRLSIGLITLYRYTLSPVLGTRCRFAPSCSCYAIEAIKNHGALGGALLTAKRLLKCHPFGPSGFDPVPPKH